MACSRNDYLRHSPRDSGVFWRRHSAVPPVWGGEGGPGDPWWITVEQSSWCNRLVAHLQHPAAHAKGLQLPWEVESAAVLLVRSGAVVLTLDAHGLLSWSPLPEVNHLLGFVKQQVISACPLHKSVYQPSVLLLLTTTYTPYNRATAGSSENIWRQHNSPCSPCTSHHHIRQDTVQPHKLWPVCQVIGDPGDCGCHVWMKNGHLHISSGI